MKINAYAQHYFKYFCRTIYLLALTFIREGFYTLHSEEVGYSFENVMFVLTSIES